VIPAIDGPVADRAQAYSATSHTVMRFDYVAKNQLPSGHKAGLCVPLETRLNHIA
jgi:hypothetical protein